MTLLSHSVWSRLETRIPPPLLVGLLGAAMWLFARQWPGAAWSWQGWPVGAGLVAFCGVVFNLWPKLAFDRARTTVNPMRPTAATQLVQTGLHGLSRNPMYLGHSLILAAWAMYLQSLPTALAVPVFMAYITRFQIRAEERALAARFGAAFSDYQARVRRWL